MTSVKMAVCWDVAPFSLTDIEGRFQDVSCLHHQSDEDDDADDGDNKFL
jgi:hypothetical protein